MIDDHRRQFVILFNVYTILLWGWVVLEFFSKGRNLTPPALANLYLVVLAYYAGDKELRRWQDRHRSVRRRGELFVLGWLATALVTLAMEILGGAQLGYRVPRQLPLIAGSVLVIFFVTEYLKSEYRRKTRAKRG